MLCLWPTSLIKRHLFKVDESGFTTAYLPDNVLAWLGRKPVESFTPAERGTLVTVALAVLTSGTAIPKFLSSKDKSRHVTLIIYCGNFCVDSFSNFYTSFYQTRHAVDGQPNSNFYLKSLLSPFF